MRTLAASLVLMLALPAWADEPVAPSGSVVLVPPVAGTLTPAQDLCLSPAEQVTLAKRLESDKAVIASLKAAPAPLHPALVVGLVVLGVVAGGAAGYGIAIATR